MQREKQAPCREPDVGLDPGTLGSQPEPQAGAQPLSHHILFIFDPIISGMVFFISLSGYLLLVYRNAMNFLC